MQHTSSEATYKEVNLTAKRADAGRTAVAYLRVSSAAQVDKDYDTEGFSLPAQRRACENKAESIGAAIIEEFVERGESARSMRRRAELHAMLERIKQGDVDYVIVHKVDRLARNRLDDAMILEEIRAAGATLVSVTENIDETPAGLLMHGIMATLSEFNSRNLATEVMKGTREKARRGGTPFRAPIGYMNITEMVDGRPVKTIAIDPERGQLISMAFKLYAKGGYSLSELAALLEANGLRNRPTGGRPPSTIGGNRLSEILRSDYYIGVVRYSGKVSEGRHPHLTDQATFDRVQSLLESHRLSGERSWRHNQYLTGSLFCAECGSRLVYSRANGNGGVYEYFVCGQRQFGKCSQTSARLEAIERAVEDAYKKVEFSKERSSRIRNAVREHVANLEELGAPRRLQVKTTLDALANEEKKLLRAHFDDEVSPRLFSEEQERIKRERSAAEREWETLSIDHSTLLARLDAALDLVGRVHDAYLVALPAERRLFNQAIFEWIKVEREEIVEARLTEPFEAMRDVEYESKKAETPETVRRLRGQNVSAAVGTITNFSFRAGSNVSNLVPRAGFEPA